MGGICSSCRQDKLPTTHVRTLMKKELNDAMVTLDINDLLDLTCFLVYHHDSTSNKYTYLKNTNGEAHWDTSIKSTPDEIYSRANVSIDFETNSVNIAPSWNKHVFNFDYIRNNRDYIKMSTEGVDIHIVCLLSSKQCAEFAELQPNEVHQFVSTEISCKVSSVIGKKIGIFGVMMSNNNEEKTGELKHVHMVSCIEHDIDNKSSNLRNRLLINSNNQVLIYENEDGEDSWHISQIDKNEPNDDLIAYMEDGVWSGDDDFEHTNVPVMICGPKGASFSSANDMPDEKLKEIDQLSNQNYVSSFESVVSDTGSIFKRANSVTMHCVSNSSKLKPFWSVSNREISDSVSCVDWILDN